MNDCCNQVFECRVQSVEWSAVFEDEGGGGTLHLRRAAILVD